MFCAHTQIYTQKSLIDLLTNQYFQLTTGGGGDDGGSQFALKGQFPFVVSLSCVSKTTGQPIVCSGSVIDDKHVLTSASCVTQCGSIHIRYNSIIVYTDGKNVDAATTFIHPFYRPSTNRYDVAIVRTASTALKYAPMVRLAQLSNYNMEREFMKNSSVIASGWGKLGAIPSPTLQFVQGKIHSNSIEEENLFLRAKFSGISGEHSYDCGSPLLVRLGENWFQIGIATSSSENNNQHGLFTSLFSTNIHNFIYKTVNYKLSV